MDKVLVDYHKVNRFRRNRGYSFEHGIILYLEKIGWRAKRLGGSSTKLPDVLATHDDTIYSMEAKSIMLPTTRTAFIPFDQVHRCIDMLTMFSMYKNRYVVFAFKFSLKGSPRPKYHYFAFDWHDVNMIKQFYQLPAYFVKFGQDLDLRIVEAEFVGKKMRLVAGAEPIPVNYTMYTTELPFTTPLTIYPST